MVVFLLVPSKPTPPQKKTPLNPGDVVSFKVIHLARLKPLVYRNHSWLARGLHNLRPTILYHRTGLL